jgi:cytochrome c556
MRFTTSLAACLLASSAFVGNAFADEGAAEYREHTMEAVGGHMQAMVDIIRQKVAHTSHLPIHADAMASLAEISDSLFPAGSEGGDALPAIWSEPEDFANRIAAFKEAAAGLKTAVEAGEPIGPAFQTLGQACKGCHDNYRAE